MLKNYIGLFLIAFSALLSPAQAQTTYLDQFTGSVVSTFGKQPVDAAATSPVTLSGYQTVDGISLNADYMRCLVMGQADETTNGIYVVFSGNWVRAGDFNGPSGTVNGQMIVSTGGTSNSGLWRLTSPNPIQIDQSGGQSTNPSAITFTAGIPGIPSVNGNNTWSGTNNFTGAFKKSGTTESFPASGNIVGTSDTQSLTNKSIVGSEINSGIVAATYLPTATSGALGVVQVDGTSITASSGIISVTSAPSAPSAPAAITGFLPSSIAGSSTTASMTISTGAASDSTNTVYIKNGSPESWSVANGNAINGYSGGTTLPSSATVHMYECSGASGVGSYAVPSSSYPLAAASCPSGYNSYARRVFSFNTASSTTGPIPYTAVETEGGSVTAWLTTQLLDVNGTNIASSARTLLGLTVPSGIKVAPQFRYNLNTGSVSIIFTSGDETDILPIQASNNQWTTAPGADQEFTGGVGALTSGNSGILTTNTSGQIGCRTNTGSSTVIYLVTRGFKDWRRN